MKREIERTEGKSCGGESIGGKEGEVNILKKREGPKKGKTDREEGKGEPEGGKNMISYDKKGHRKKRRGNESQG